MVKVKPKEMRYSDNNVLILSDYYTVTYGNARKRLHFLTNNYIFYQINFDVHPI